MRADKKMRFNFQMTDLQAAIGIAQLKKLPQFLERREFIYRKYRDAGLLPPDNEKKSFPSKPVRYRAIVRTKKAGDLKKQLAGRHIAAIVPLEDWELLSATPHALQYCRETLSIPLYPALSNEQVESIIQVLI
jgi:perosamine synthetase